MSQPPVEVVEGGTPTAGMGGLCACMCVCVQRSAQVGRFVEGQGRQKVTLEGRCGEGGGPAASACHRTRALQHYMATTPGQAALACMHACTHPFSATRRQLSGSRTSTSSTAGAEQVEYVASHALFNMPVHWTSCPITSTGCTQPRTQDSIWTGSVAVGIQERGAGEGGGEGKE